MEDLSSEIFENSKILVKEVYQKNFFLKLLLLFSLYLVTNYVFDRIDHEDLVRTFHSNPHINIKLPKNTTFKIIITLIMILLSHYVYKLFIKPFIYNN